MLNVARSLKNLFNSSHFRDILVNLSSSAISSFLGLIFFVSVSRTLGPNSFGIFSGLIAFSLLLSDVCDLGIGVSIPRFISQHDMTESNQKLSQFLGLTFLTKIGLILFVCLLGFLFTPVFLKLIFNNGISRDLFGISLIGAIILTLFNFSGVALQSRRRYLRFGISNILGNGSRLVLIIAILLLTKLSIQTSILVYILGSLISAIIGLTLLPFKILRAPTTKDVKEFFFFNRWLSIAIILSAIYSRLDNVLLVNLNGSFQTGLYGAASRITFIFPLLISALSGVWSVQFSIKGTRQEADKLFFETLQIVLLISLGMSIIIPLSGVIINLVYGKAFAQSIFPMQLLFLGWIISLICVPAFQYVIYFLGNSRLYTMIIFIQFIAIVGLDFLLIPSTGALGAAGAFLIGNFVTLLVSYFIVSLSRAT